jgi:hypothetical protein
MHVPIVCSLWFSRSGSKCIVQIVAETDDELDQPNVAAVVSFLNESSSCFEVHAYVSPRAKLLVKVARIFVSLFAHLPHDTVITIIDENIWPVNTSLILLDPMFYMRRGSSGRSVKVTGIRLASTSVANSSFLNFESLRVHGTSASVMRWRDVLGFAAFGDRLVDVRNGRGRYEEVSKIIETELTQVFGWVALQRDDIGELRIRKILTALPSRTLVLLFENDTQRALLSDVVADSSLFNLTELQVPQFVDLCQSWSRYRSILQLLLVDESERIDQFVALWNASKTAPSSKCALDGGHCLYSQADIRVYIHLTNQTPTNSVQLLYRSVVAVFPATFVVSCNGNTSIEGLPHNRIIRMREACNFGEAFAAMISESPDGAPIGSILGDVRQTSDWPKIGAGALAALNHKDIGVYAPNIQNTSHVGRGRRLWGNVFDVQNTDSTCFFLHPAIVRGIRPIPFGKLSAIGWGIDTVFAEESRRQNMLVARDYDVLVGANSVILDETTARAQMIQLLAYYSSMLKY